MFLTTKKSFCFKISLKLLLSTLKVCIYRIKDDKNKNHIYLAEPQQCIKQFYQYYFCFSFFFFLHFSFTSVFDVFDGLMVCFFRKTFQQLKKAEEKPQSDVKERSYEEARYLRRMSEAK